MVKVGSQQPTVSLTGIADSEGKVKIILFWETAHLPSPQPTLTLASHLGKKVGLGEGQVGSFPEKYIDPSK